jgi:hypothetical protein
MPLNSFPSTVSEETLRLKVQSVFSLGLPVAHIHDWSFLSLQYTLTILVLYYQLDAARDKLYVDVGKWRDSVSSQTSRPESLFYLLLASDFSIFLYF